MGLYTCDGIAELEGELMPCSKYDATISLIAVEVLAFEGQLSVVKLYHDAGVVPGLDHPSLAVVYTAVVLIASHHDPTARLQQKGASIVVSLLVCRSFLF